MLKTYRTTAGDFRFRVTEETTDQEIAVKIAKRLGYRDAWVTRGSGFYYWEANIGTWRDGCLQVARTVTVYR